MNYTKTASEELKEFGNAIKAIQAPLIFPINPGKGKNEWLAYDQTCWVIVARWVVRNRLGLWSRRDYPFNTKLFKQHEMWATFLTDILSLSIACHDETSKSPYSSGFEHWMYILTEIRLSGVIRIFCEGGVQKRSYERELRTDLRHLKNFVNPYCPSKEKHHHALISSAIPLAEKTYGKSRKVGFYARYYAPILESFRLWLNQLHEFDALVVEEADLKVRKGAERELLTVQTVEVSKLNFVTLSS